MVYHQVTVMLLTEEGEVLTTVAARDNLEYGSFNKLCYRKIPDQRLSSSEQIADFSAGC